MSYVKVVPNIRNYTDKDKNEQKLLNVTKIAKCNDNRMTIESLEEKIERL